MRSFLFLVNERARGGDTVRRVQRLLESASLQGVDVLISPFVDDDGIRTGLARLDSTRTPVAVGGDGTVGSVARLLREVGLADRPMGVLPLGTGNGLAHSLGIARLPTAVETLLSGTPQSIDAMTTTHPDAPLSLLNLSVGIESLAIREYQTWRQHSRWLGGLVGGVRHGLRRVAGVMLEADGERIVDTSDRICNVGLHNMPRYGFCVEPKPSADPTDGFADLRLHSSIGHYWLYMGAAVLRRASPIARQPNWPKIRQATVSTSLPVQVDGESLPAATFDVEVVPAAVQILVPSPD